MKVFGVVCVCVCVCGGGGGGGGGGCTQTDLNAAHNDFVLFAIANVA